MSTPHILTIGSAVRDIFLFSPAFAKHTPKQFSQEYDAPCLALGAKIDIEDCVFSTGGGATNTAATFARLGFPTSIFTKIGHDEPGKIILADLEERGISTHLIKKDPKGKTGYSTILTAPDGERTVLVFRGVNATWCAQDIPKLPEQIDTLYITSLGGSIEALEKIFSRAKKHVRIILNPGAGELKKPSALLPLLSRVQILILNKEEARLLTGKVSEEIPALAARLHRVCPLVVITDGAHGSYAHDEHRLWFARTSSNIISPSRTGAGDAFGSAFSAAIISGNDTATALKIGTLNAENVVRHIGAKTGILSTWPSNIMQSKVRVTPARTS